MDKADEIVAYLCKQYSPAAIMLHGSRSTGKARPHSDWDMYLLYEGDPMQKFHREAIAGEDVEWKAVRVPIPDEKFFDTFGVVLQNAQVLWEEGDAGSKLLAQAHAFYGKGMQLSTDEHAKYKQFMLHKVYGMEDDIDSPYMFLRHLCEFFNRAVNWWYQLHGEYNKPFYTALPDIQEHDPAYYALLMILCEENPRKEKIEAAKQVVEHLFK